MPLINTSVPNLIQGVSQQSDATRFAGQCEEQENALSSITGGLTKRPNSEHINKLLNGDLGINSFVHFINRSPFEKYVVILNSSTNKLHVFDLDGNEKEINPEGREIHGDGLPMTGHYLDTVNPREQLKAVTVSDSTFIVNKDKVVLEDQSSETPEFDKEALVFIKQGDYGKQYGFKINAIIENTVTTTTTYEQEDVTVNTSDALFNVHLRVSSIEKWGNVGGGGIANQEYGITGYDNVWQIRENDGVTLRSNGGGGGFAEGDVIQINTPTAGDGKINNSGIFYHNQRPKIRVTEVDSGGAITGIEVVNRGMWKGTGNSANATRTYVTSVSSTNSTTSQTTTYTETITTTNDEEVPITIEATSGTGLTSNGNTTNPAHADATNILQKVIDKANEREEFRTSSEMTGGLNYFDMDESQKAQNLFTIKARSPIKSFSISGFDGLNGMGIGVIYKEVNSISDLPTYAKNKFKVKVKGDAELSEDDYYVEFKTTGGTTYGTGSWVECIGEKLIKNFDRDTLPIELVSEPTGGFTYRPMTLEDRNAGDNDSNPLPSFVNKQINNVFFFKNRLGFLCEDNIIFSEAGFGLKDLSDIVNFNFSRKTVATLLDDDPIDITVSTSRVTSLNASVGFQENLILFSDNGQFVLKGGDLLTAKTISVSPVTNFEMENSVDPLLLGSYIYFTFERDRFSGVREYTVNSTTDVYDSVEITEHVPAYIPRNIIHMAGSSAEDILAFISRDEPKFIYVYYYFWDNRQKVLSAWSKFKIEGTDGIRGMKFIDGDLYLVLLDGTGTTGTHLIKIPFSAGNKDFYGNVSVDRITLLDMRTLQYATTGKFKFTGATDNVASYNNVEYLATDRSNEGRIEYENSVGSTRFKFKYGKWYLCADSGSTEVNLAVSSRNYTKIAPWEANWGNTKLSSATFTEIGTRNKVYLPYKPHTNKVEVYRTNGSKVPSTNSSNSNVVTLDRTFNQNTFLWVGYPYTMKYTFSEQLFKAKVGSGSTVTNAAKVLLRNGSIYYDDTYKFDVLVSPKGKSTMTASFDNGTQTEDGFFRFPVLSPAEDTTITIQNSSVFPSNFQSAEFESFVHARSNRYG